MPGKNGFNEEIWEQVVTFQVNMKCPGCGIGAMDFEDFEEPEDNLIGEQPEFEHVCPICTHREKYPNVYPRIEYKKISEFQKRK